MEPIEINAGTHYLRQFRADDRLDDRPALLTALPESVRTHADATAYIEARAAGWRDDDHYTWAVAELTTGTLIGEVRLELDDATAHLTAWTHPDARRQGVAATAVSTVLRFGFGALDLSRVDAVCAEDDAAAVALAHRCGFSRDGSAEGQVHWSVTPV
ncbi:MAG: GNAT family N-acetyltransferase [Actinophytocola sp.]|nr:GNAT family N-acetyltransferase [Actinophytocola sp.]